MRVAQKFLPGQNVLLNPASAGLPCVRIRSAVRAAGLPRSAMTGGKNSSGVPLS